jgi:hypothetical protein
VNNTRRRLIVSSSGASKGTPLPPPQYVSPREKKLKTWGEQSKSCAEGFMAASSAENRLEQ